MEAFHPMAFRSGDIPERFNNPFRYVPCRAVLSAAETVTAFIDSDRRLRGIFSEGKMLGVLIVEKDGQTGFLAAFSGNAGGLNRIPFFVPPVYDLLDPEGYFKKEEKRISGLNTQLRQLKEDPQYIACRKEACDAETDKEKEVSSWKEKMEESRRRRRMIRQELSERAAENGTDGDSLSAEDSREILDRLTRESQYEKAQLRRIISAHDARIAEAGHRLKAYTEREERIKEERRKSSDALQKWIFDTHSVMNAAGESKTIASIFSSRGLVPPSGTGECAAPKLLQYAYLNGCRPLAMGEFWYGKTQGEEIRCEGRFYPSCTGKCGPLLDYMLTGIGPDGKDCGQNVMPEGKAFRERMRIMYEDNWIVAVDKPSGMPSVPGKDGRISAEEILRDTGREIHAVHRLDMDTSGILIFAKTEAAARELRKQFGSKGVEKLYLALLDIPKHWCHRQDETGTISLPLSADYINRPRQCVSAEGKEAETLYRIILMSEDRALVTLRPLTGRTHQLRIHSAHHLGLDAPISGDMLYGSAGSAPRLCLHAAYISFTHPSSGKKISLRSSCPFEDMIPGGKEACTGLMRSVL